MGAVGGVIGMCRGDEQKTGRDGRKEGGEGGHGRTDGHHTHTHTHCVHIPTLNNPNNQTFAVLWKRGWAEEGAAGKQDFFGQVQALAQQPQRAVSE